MRNVLAKYWDKEKREFVPTFGKFHQWAASYNEFEEGPGNFTVALVEDEKGQIRECDPSSVQFIKEQQ
jgi:hypothetical protein